MYFMFVMFMSNEIKIGGVTEHFNLPWNLAVEQNKFQQAGVDLNWKFFSGGTGVMTEALRTGELDLAILLTEGFISAAAKGLQAKIVKEYITSPLGWGIFTANKSQFYSVYNRQPKKYAISKLGSGSHLMAMIHAEQRGEKIGAEDLIEVKSIDGAMDSLTQNEAQIFYWEKYTTKPFVENGTVRMIGEFSAPWSSFLIVASDTALQTKRTAISKVLEVVNKESEKFVTSQQSVVLLMERFKMSEHDALIWLNSTVWSADYSVRLQGLENAKQALIKIGSVSADLSVAELCDTSMSLT
jgi:sulfonate transport system substrate-binding protein